MAVFRLHWWQLPAVTSTKVTYEDENDLLTGEWSFRHDVLTSECIGTPVVAVEILQAKVGYVYAPLLESDPVEVRLLDSDKMWTQNQALPCAWHLNLSSPNGKSASKATPDESRAARSRLPPPRLMLGATKASDMVILRRARSCFRALRSSRYQGSTPP